jgi:hypothetical protein
MLESETLFCASTLFSVSDWETESARSSSVSAKPLAMGWATLSSLNASDAYASELVLVQESF